MARTADTFPVHTLAALVVTGIGTRLEQSRVDTRSPLYRWLYANHEQLAPRLNGPRPPWAALARMVAATSEWRGGGSAPSRQAVKGTWLRVNKDVARFAAQSAQRPGRQPEPHAEDDLDWMTVLGKPIERAGEEDDGFVITDITGKPIK
jgi:hypothetical protein